MVGPSGAEYSPGDIVGKTYVIMGYIGRGAMGFVYHARHVDLPKEYALKTLRSDQITDTAWFRFQMEAQSVAKMFHPNIVSIHNFGSHKAENGLEQPFYVMDLLHGASLMERLRDQGPPPLPVILQIFIQAASGFGYAHSKGIIHRDVKPGNIMLLNQPDAMGASVKIVDFGIAKLTAEADKASQQLTRDGDIVGSPYYMSPEQSLGYPTDSRSDIYSLGVSLFETLTGEAPFSGPSAVDIMLMHQSAPVPDINKFGDHADSGGVLIYPASVQLVVEQMMAKAPEQRYQTMEHVAADLWAILQNGTIEALAQPPYAVPGQALPNQNIDEEDSENDDFGDDNVVESDLVENDSENITGELDLVVGDVEATEPGEADSDGQDAPPVANMLQTGRAIARVQTIPQRVKLPTAQLTFLVITLATAAVTALIFFVSKSSQSAVSIAKPVIKKTVPVAAKIDAEEDKEPGSSRSETTPYCTIKRVKGDEVKSFDFPSDCLIGSISYWHNDEGKWETVKAKGHLEFDHSDWLMFIPSRMVAKYPQYLKRFRKGDVSAIRFVENSDSDALFEACTAIPGISEIKFYNTKHLTNNCIPSLSKFKGLKLLDASNSTIAGTALAKASCYDDLEKFYFSRGKDLSPILDKLTSSKKLELLDVHRCPLSYQDYKTIASFPALRNLDISHIKVTKAQLGHLAKSVSLEELDMSGCDLDQEKIKLILGMRRLKSIDISHFKVTKSIVSQLAQSNNLEELEMRDCGLDEEFIPLFRKMKNLKTLQFIVYDKTPEKLRDRFKAGLPGVKIE